MVPIHDFMSHEHVAQMNALFAESTELAASAAAFGGIHRLTYELAGAPNGTQFWTFEVSPDGVRFVLDDPSLSSDVIIRTDWVATMRMSRDIREGREPALPEQSISGDPIMLTRLQKILGQAQTIGTVDSNIPKV